MLDGVTNSPSWSRLKLYAQAILLAELIGVLLLLIARLALPETESQIVVASDFRVFWAAGQIALGGTPADSYNLANIFTVIQAQDPSIAESRASFGWFYPPTFLLIVQVLARLPLWLAYFLFVGGSFAAYVLTLRNISGRLHVLWPVLAFQPVLLAVFNGQNAFLTAALAGTALQLLDRRPVIAGICIGLLAIKPQFAVLFPIALICGRHWHAFAAATVTTVAFTGLALMTFGWDVFPAFLNGLHEAHEAIIDSNWELAKMPSVFATSMAAGMNGAAANAMQVLAAFGAIAVVAWSWRRKSPAPVRNAILILATLMVSPHLCDYDLTWLGLPLAWMAAHGWSAGWLPGERVALVCTWLAPLALESLGHFIGPNLVVLTPVMLLGFLIQHCRAGAPIISQEAACATAAPHQQNGRA